MTTFRALFAALMVVVSFGLAIAKLPPPPPMDDAAKAAAEQKKGKDAVAAEAAKQLQARTEDRVAARYIAEQKAKGIIVTPQMDRHASQKTQWRIRRRRSRPAIGKSSRRAAQSTA